MEREWKKEAKEKEMKGKTGIKKEMDGDEQIVKRDEYCSVTACLRV